MWRTKSYALTWKNNQTLETMFLGIIGPNQIVLFSMLIPFLILFVFYSIAKVIANMAENREISRKAAFWISFLLGPIIGLIVVLVSPMKKEVYPTKNCPECAESVKEQAKLCKHCGYRWSA